MATLAQIAPAKRAMSASADTTVGNLVVVDSAGDPTATFLHGACLADFAVTCGNLPGVTIWAPVQDECSLGTLANNIDQTLFLDKVYVNSLEFGYTTGANATENYGAETDNKTWLLNDGRFVNQDTFEVVTDMLPGGATEYAALTIADGDTVAVLSAGLGFLRKDANGTEAVTWYDVSTDTVVNIPVMTFADNSNSTTSATHFIYYDTGTGHQMWLPTNAGFDIAIGDRLEMVYSADAYGTSTQSDYFEILSDTSKPDFVGAIRQGQVEIYIVDATAAAYDISWRLTGCTITSDLTREPLAELGHLAPYDRPLTLPIPITVTVDSTAGDLENWSKVANKLSAYDAGTLDDIDLADLMASEDLKLIVMIYAQTDEEAGGTGLNRVVDAASSLVGQDWFYNGDLNDNSAGQADAYVAGDIEYPLKTIIVEHLKITDEGMTLDMGANATQTFGFRSTNDLYVVKGGLAVDHITDGYKVRRNAA